MIGKTRRLLGISLLAIAAGCSQTDKPGEMGVAGGIGQQASQPSVIQGACPQVYLREGTAVHRAYARGAKDDPQKLLYQATLSATTRQCVQNESNLTVTVMAQGRVVSGPAGASGAVTLPIRVAATDGSKTLYSNLSKFSVTIPPEGTAQYVFTDAQVVLPGGAGSFSKIYVGFDEGPYNTQ
ncbi:hypothetical protein OCK02_04815 (plasmid) [Rhizobium sp. TRM96647]|uniref:hypothetical protein n=1 Tax=unclassified Rhizobium TaxID=2613769 RepID=UPI001E4ABAD7|nr:MULTISPECIES: hypothetical protein [unclassified Rhizobium]MCD2180787.1 hypothetical protein [Rhizobium sp. GN54]MCV3735519.1 hypothetical protein [Rhizobium sp. TRM96647]MCV3757718.1 hypothetical protein [Rhizobium sp. TRM96650]